MTSLAVQPASGTATFNGRVSVVDITDSNRPVTIDGDASLQVTMADLGEPGSSDLIAITVWNRNGGLWFASNWSGTGTDQQVLAGGDLQVKGNNGPPVARAALSNSALSGADPPEPSGRALPLQYAFPQNFPNPFSTSTSIRFDLPERSQVSLVVYDVMGRVVANLVDGPVDAGFHVTEWSGRSREGYPAAAGVYFVRMSAASLGGSGGLRSDRRIILVK
jgi:hypothetical protein